MHRSHQSAIDALHRLVARGRSEAAFRTDLPVELLVTAALGLIHAVAEATRAGVLDSDAAGAAAETLVTELWDASAPAGDPVRGNLRPAKQVSE